MLLLLATTLAAGTAQAALSIEDALGQFVFAQFVDREYWCGYVEFDPAHGFVWVTHVDQDLDQVEDRFEVLRGTFEVRRNAGGELGLYLQPAGREPSFLEDLDFHGLTLSAFNWQGFAFQRRDGGDPLFDMSGNKLAQSGPVEVLSEPAGAALLLDGKRVAGGAPLTIPSVSADVEHTLRAELAGYLPYVTTFRVGAGQPKRVQVKFSTGSATLALKTEPEVKVWLDQKFVGVTPLWREGMLAGTHHVELRNDALGIHEEFDVTLDQGQVWKKIMRWEGRLELAADVACEVFLDERSLGTTPLNITLPIGMHALDLRPAGSERGKRLFVRIELDRTASLDVVYDEID